MELTGNALNEWFVLHLFFYAICSRVVQVCVHDMPSCKKIDMDDIDIYIYTQKWCCCKKVQLKTLIQLK